MTDDKDSPHGETGCRRGPWFPESRAKALLSLFAVWVLSLVPVHVALTQSAPRLGAVQTGVGGDTCSVETKEALDKLTVRTEDLKKERTALLQGLVRGERESYLQNLKRLKTIDDELSELRRLLTALASTLRKELKELFTCGGPRAITAGKWLMGLVLLPDPTDVLIWVVLGEPLGGDDEPLSCLRIKNESETLSVNVARLCSEEIVTRYGYPVSCLLNDDPCLACKRVLDKLLSYQDHWDRWCVDTRSRPSSPGNSGGTKLPKPKGRK
ncbi:MAG: hypothetical protein RL518_1350 [Pseudomonadota bacterium]|jgi:hypothetical protein